MINGLIIRQLREDNDITFDELSKKTGVSCSALRALESGFANPNIQTLRAISGFYNVPVTYLLDKASFRDELHNILMYLVKEGVMYATTAAAVKNRMKR